MKQSNSKSTTSKLKTHLQKQKYAYLVGASSIAIGIYLTGHLKGALNNLGLVTGEYLESKGLDPLEYFDYLDDLAKNKR